MSKVSLKRVVFLVIMTSLITSCTSLEDEQKANTVTTTEEVTTLGISESENLVEFNEYTTKKNKDNSYNLTITQERMENCYYVISLMYDDQVLEFVNGDGYLKSSYGKFAGEIDEDITSTVEDEEETTTKVTEEVTTMSSDEIKSLIGKDGKWTFKSISEGTQYIEIKLINEFGDIRYKSQFTCIVDTHLEPHMYYTSINY